MSGRAAPLRGRHGGKIAAQRDIALSRLFLTFGTDTAHCSLAAHGRLCSPGQMPFLLSPHQPWWLAVSHWPVMPSFVKSMTSISSLSTRSPACLPRRPRYGRLLGLQSTCSGVLTQKTWFIPSGWIPPLTAVATKGSSAYERLAAGMFILAILARARWSDFNRTINIILDFHSETPSSDGSDYVEFQARNFKTSSTAKRKLLLLPMVAPVFSISGQPWFEAWLQARTELRLPRSGAVTPPLLPAWGSDGIASEVPVDCADAEVIEGLVALCRPQNKEPLSWMAKYGCHKGSRQLLGYHLDPKEVSVMTYSSSPWLTPMKARGQL